MLITVSLYAVPGVWSAGLGGSGAGVPAAGGGGGGGHGRGLAAGHRHLAPAAPLVRLVVGQQPCSSDN